MPKTVASVELYDLVTDRFVRIGLVKCCHCQQQFELAPGKTKGRGWCGNCMGYVCGQSCANCVPWERQLENIEAGLPENAPGPTLARGGWEPLEGGRVLVPANLEF